MEKFIVSARKYRPQTFDTVIGQSHITTTLKNAIRQQHLAHAFLFCGPRGVGKTTCARILAKTINCESPDQEGEACNQCSSCLSFNEGGSLNYFELDAASNNSVDDIRHLVEQVRFVPQTGKYKVYVIDEVHMLTSSAFNAFLKTLEEPPSYVKFILATTEKHKIIPTILSRCQIFDFKRITFHDIADHLQQIAVKESINAEKAALQIIAQKSEGCMRDALSILDKIVSFTNGELTYGNTLEHLNILDADYYFSMLEAMQKEDLPSILLMYDEINGKGFEGDLVLNGFAEFIRNLLVCKDPRAAALLEVVEGFKQKYTDTAASVSPAMLISSLNILNEAEMNYKAARNKRLHVEMALIKLCYLQQALELTADTGQLSKKKLIEKTKPLAFRKITSYRPERIQEPEITPEPKLLIQTSPGPKEQTPKLKTELPATPAPSTRPVAASGGKLSALDKIRHSQKGNGNTQVMANLPLELESLQAAWKDYVQYLKDTKNPAAQSFDLAVLRIRDENSFEAVTANNIERQFIEQDRNALFAFLKQKLQNRILQISVLVEEKLEDRPKPEVSLTSKEQYLKMCNIYPVVKELRERLRLDLDY